MIRKLLFGLVAVAVIVLGTPWQICREVWSAWENYCLWVLDRWDATKNRMGLSRRGEW